MTVLTVDTVATILMGGAAAPIAAAAAAGAGTGGAAAAVAGVAETAASAALCATAAAGVGTASLGATAGCIATGPVGWIVLGVTKEKQSSGIYTFDCWKPVLHDVSRESSNGKLLKDVACDSRIKQKKTTNNNTDLPTFILQNVWDEEFRIEYVYLPNGQLTAHAVQI